ncbi:biotin transporter BioY [Egicoccus halophilus]|uniref:Biotin biosynthesis protein BioY n=1 Tax=Egicoccus halophilus TaxID=1670830 RepID=A0A8J3A8N8_9ACTN|nr:biotin transporter BioY [Egicoccus halophilus]GGI06775.1 biotin biosynthesis protein BioY [Egicoccus halophilus]
MSSVASSSTDHHVLSDVIPGTWVRDGLLAVGFAGAIAASAQMQFALPGTTVPFTAQTFAVLAGALALGRGRAAVGSLLYLALGVVGLPWFSGAGPHTIGYIVGFVAAAALVGTLARRLGTDRPGRVVLAMAAGNLVIWACGATGLALVLGLSPVEAIAAGVVPFLLGDAVKLLAAAGVLPATWALVRGVQRRRSPLRARHTGA